MSQLGIVSDGAILIRGGLILEVGPTRRVENLAIARRAQEIEAAGKVVMPGFVDCHTHLLNGSWRPGDPTRTVRTSTAQRLQHRAQAHVQTMSRHGATTVEVKTGSGIDSRAEIKLLRVLGALNGHSMNIVPTFFLNPASEFRDREDHTALPGIMEQLLSNIRRRRLARFADVEWNSGMGEFYERHLAMARRYGLALKVHAGPGRTREAIAAAIRTLAVSVDHLEQATAEEAAVLAGSPTMAVLTPASMLGGGQPAPARTLIDAGVPMALASNFDPHTTPILSMQTVVALACLYLGLTYAEAISASTINGAHALGCAQTVGSIEPGKSADIVFLKTGDCRDLAGHVGENLVLMTMKAGKVIYQEGEVAPRELPDRPAWW
jgi:imidazolonepropionase